MNNQTLIDGLVSVIIPVYNGEKYIREAIESVLAQSYKKIEVIVVDDCSTDHSKEIVEKIKNIHFNIYYYRLSKNQGAAVARNMALKNARGRYIAFLDCDDLWKPEKTKEQIEFMNGKIAFCYSNYCIINSEGKLIQNKIKTIKKLKYANMLTHTVVATPTVVIDRYLTGTFEMPLRRTGQDYALWLLLLRKFDAYCYNKVLVVVRKRKNSLSKNKFQSISDVWNIQHGLEHIGCFKAIQNTIFYCYNAIKK